MLPRFTLRLQPGVECLTAAMMTRPIAIQEEQALVRARSCVLSRLSVYRVQTVPKRKSPVKNA